MADVESNLLEHEREFREFVNSFDFTVPGKEGSLGKDLAVAAAQAVIDRTVADQLDATGGSLKPLSPAYKARKLREFNVGLIGVRSGQMLSQQSMLGEVEIEPDSVTMSYGTGEAPSGSSTGGKLRDDEPTDKEKADWFTEQGRPFYELTEAEADRVREVAAEALADYIAGS